MLMFATRHVAVPALMRAGVAMQWVGRRTLIAAKRLGRWHARADAAANALTVTESMTERELFDIGLVRPDVRPLAWIASEAVPQPPFGAGAPLTSRERRALVTCALWLQVGLIGASMAFAGIVQWIDGDFSLPAALAAVLGGSVFARVSWRCARTALDVVA